MLRHHFKSDCTSIYELITVWKSSNYTVTISLTKVLHEINFEIKEFYCEVRKDWFHEIFVQVRVNFSVFHTVSTQFSKRKLLQEGKMHMWFLIITFHDSNPNLNSIIKLEPPKGVRIKTLKIWKKIWKDCSHLGHCIPT